MMGMMICDKHGQQSMAFTSPLIAELIKNENALSPISAVYKVKIPYFDMIGSYLVDDIFVAENKLSLLGEISTQSEEHADAVFEKLLPVCSKCLQGCEFVLKPGTQSKPGLWIDDKPIT